MSAFVRNGGIREVLECLAEGPKTVRQLRDALGLSAEIGTGRISYCQLYGLAEPVGEVVRYGNVWQLTDKGRKRLEAETEAPAAQSLPEPAELVPGRLLSVMGTALPAERPFVGRPDAYDFLRCTSRRGSVLVPMAEIHHDPR